MPNVRKIKYKKFYDIYDFIIELCKEIVVMFSFVVCVFFMLVLL